MTTTHNDIDVNALALLVEIIDAGSLSAVADRHKVSRSAISHRLKLLETALGVQLLRRTTRRIQPTEIGQRLCEHGRIIADQMAQVRAQASAMGDTPRGVVRLSVPTGLGEALIARLLIDFKLLYPQVEVEVLFENGVVDLLVDEVDVAIRMIPAPPDALRALDLGPVDWVMCAAPSYLARTGRPTRLDQVLALDVVSSFPAGQKLTLVAMRGGERCSVVVAPSLRSKNFNFLRQAVVAGLGVGVLPYYLVEAELASQRLVGLLADHSFCVAGRQAMLLAIPDRFRTAASRALIDFLKVRIRNELAALRERFAASQLEGPRAVVVPAAVAVPQLAPAKVAARTRAQRLEPSIVS